MLPPVWCTIYILLLDQCYTRSEKIIASPATIKRHLHNMDHPLDLQCHPLQYVCSSFKVEVEGEGELITEVMVEMVMAVVVHLSRHCLLQYPPPPILTRHPRFLYPHTLTHHLPYPQTLTHLYHIQCSQSQPP